MSDPYRLRYAVDVQFLDADGKESGAPVYNAVPLPMAGSESGMFQFPPVGTVVEIAFEDGRQDKPFIRQPLSQGNTCRILIRGSNCNSSDRRYRSVSRGRVVGSGRQTRKSATNTVNLEHKGKDPEVMLNYARFIFCQ